MIESITDNQLREFRLNNTGKEKVLANGLWAYSRHPNYFGEILFWWGLFVFSLGESIDNWWMGVGALSITLIFFFISVPMIDKRMKERRPAYLAHCKRVPAILFWFPKK